MTISERLAIYQATRIPQRPKVVLRVVVDLRVEGAEVALAS